nr:hypothetical protein Iba_chr06aCG0330 [Ipomoea batatas]GMD04997.1 hypothetical protein Iba_chr06bCG2430 [Ipomoea batatas]
MPGHFCMDLLQIRYEDIEDLLLNRYQLGQIYQVLKLHLFPCKLSLSVDHIHNKPIYMQTRTESCCGCKHPFVA